MKMAAQQNNIPQHVAIIMDGNGRWAKQRGLQRIFGHRNGVEAVRAATETAAKMGVKYLTLYAFSTENWARPQLEVSSLMSLLVDAIEKEEPTLNKNNVRFTTIGNVPSLPEKVQQKLAAIECSTQKNTGLTLVVALSYSGRWDIVNAVKKIANSLIAKELEIEDVNEISISKHLSTAQMPDVDLFIRTGGDVRVSNFLLWQIAYSELVFLPVLWPDFREKHFAEAVEEFQKRERRFGKVLEE
ncbi:MAG: isoprenyl transferase [Prevotellaceae bacterium]|jgi:undecaprenyl diphosphate synthase|nr:isoprenyl transferase [Prevotellaceae bacterium]